MTYFMWFVPQMMTGMWFELSFEALWYTESVLFAMKYIVK